MIPVYPAVLCVANLWFLAGYSRQRWGWWEAVILTRKFFIMCIVVFISDDAVQGLHGC